MPETTLSDVLVAIGRIEGQLAEMDHARSQARIDLERRLDGIERQVTATNGRVTSLEKAREYARGMRASFSWAPAVVSSVITAGLLAGVAYLATH